MSGGQAKEVTKVLLNVGGVAKELYTSVNYISVVTVGVSSGAYGYAGFPAFGNMAPASIPTNKGTKTVGSLYYHTTNNLTYVNINGSGSTKLTMQIEGITSTSTSNMTDWFTFPGNTFGIPTSGTFGVVSMFLH
ncbi:MAG: hypothetical protein B0D91_10595 [Oceanospirillales bacterium LUC14_002_19_P2]|nr:MAG: hypothetical protein B0D91_10595 [Oceanospirillales bacterium LUC14_002_19_P2]